MVLHLVGSQTWGWFPIIAEGSVEGVLGFDALSIKEDWPPALTHLFQAVGQLMLHGLSRKLNELDWLKRHKEALRQAIQSHRKKTSPKPASKETREAEVYVINEPEIDLAEAIILEPDFIDPKTPEVQDTPWLYEPVTGKVQVGDSVTVPLIDQRVQVTCPQCMAQDMVDLSLVEELGKQVSAICGCGHQFVFIPEQRGFYRKPVTLEGVFLRKQGTRVVSDSMAYEGKMQITNLSKQGLGFTVFGSNNLQLDDEVRVRFTLDNIAQSQITKNVKIKGLKDQYAGGRFIGTDKDDITLGFYMM
jgi:hypothetical protein